MKLKGRTRFETPATSCAGPHAAIAKTWRNCLFVFLAIALPSLAMSLSPSAGRADDGTAVDELKDRIDALGSSNWALLKTANQRKTIPAAPDDEPEITQVAAVEEGADQTPPAAEQPANEDLQSVLQRLDRAETLIQSQQQQLDEQQSRWKPFSAGNSAKGNWLGDGLTFTSNDGDFKYHLGGVAQLDFVGFANTPNSITIPGGAGIQESTNFRRLRVRAEGTMYDNIDWVSEFDFALALQNTDQLNASAQNLGLRSFPTGVGVQAGNTINVIQPTTVFMTLKDIPIVGNVRIGSQHDWFNLEATMSARFQDFMERSPIMDAFSGANNNGYAPGISVFNNTPDKNAGLQLGIYKNNTYDSGFTYDIGDAWIYGGRVIWTPYYDEQSNGRYLVHTGFGSQFRTMNTNVSATTSFDNVRVRSRGDLRTVSSTLDPNFADTGNFYATSQTLIDPELAIVWGPWFFQSEYTGSWFNGAKAAQNLPNSQLGRVFMQGGYAEALVFLTGENKDYNRQAGTFGRVVPKQNFHSGRGTWGAWQVGVRFDWLDLNSGPQPGGTSIVNGGNNQDVTIGLNWFLNPNARFQLNYVCSWINNAPTVTYPGTVGSLNGSRFTGDGTINSFGARMDFNF